MLAVIMAGGEGKRLRPLSENIPKPMIRILEKPILEIVIKQLQSEGFTDIVITTGYKGNMIKEYFKDGSKWGVNIRYTSEEKPLGTVGALSLIETRINDSFLVINGDILTRQSFRNFINYHNTNRADLTLGLVQYKIKVPFGVVNKVGMLLNTIDEKPEYLFDVGAGIYAVNPKVLSVITYNGYLDLTELISVLSESKFKIICYDINEYWRDIGIKEDYYESREEIKNWTEKDLYHRKGYLDK